MFKRKSLRNRTIFQVKIMKLNRRNKAIKKQRILTLEKITGLHY